MNPFEDEEENFENHYICPYDKTEWSDIADSMCNDRCPECNKEIQPTESIQLISDEELEKRASKWH
jgi:hypothetical protein